MLRHARLGPSALRQLVAQLAAHTTRLAPEETALILAVGFVLGTFPVLGLGAVLCLAAALVFRLNLAALQLAGQIATPAQYALLLPLARLGGRLLGFHPGIAGAALHAIAGWCCLCLPLGTVLYVVLIFLLRSRARNSEGALQITA